VDVQSYVQAWAIVCSMAECSLARALDVVRTRSAFLLLREGFYGTAHHLTGPSELDPVRRTREH
jgi:hypothetical protein